MRNFINIIENQEPTIVDHDGDGYFEFNGFGVHAEIGGNEIGTFTSMKSGQGNGRRAVAWLKNHFGELVVDDPGFPFENPDSFAFWKRMAEDGLVDRIDMRGTAIFHDGKWDLDWNNPEIVNLYGPGFPELISKTDQPGKVALTRPVGPEAFKVVKP